MIEQPVQAARISDQSSIGNGIDVASRAAGLRALRVKSSHVHTLIDHWLDIAGDRLMPRKSDFQPMAIACALPFVTMHEHIRDDFIRFRVLGTGLAGIYGSDMTGRNYLDFVREDWRSTAIARLKVLTEHPCGLMTEVIGPYGHDLNCRYETVGFPLADDQDRMRWMIYVAEPVETGLDLSRAKRVYLNALEPQYIDIGIGVPVLPEAVPAQAV